MSEYIDREGYCKNLCHCRNKHCDKESCPIWKAPTADVAPVVHGRWIPDGDGYHWTYNCSICAWKDGYPFNERHNFCPRCGARMDLEASKDE